MSDTKISAMPAAATLDGTEITPIVQSGVNKQVTTADYVSQVLDVNPVLTTQGGTDITSYTLGDMLYASATDTLATLAGNMTSTQKFLAQTGTGSVSAAPGWVELNASSINLAYGAFLQNGSTTLTNTISNNSTSPITIGDTTEFGSSGYAIIENEIIQYVGKSSTQLGTTSVTRGVKGTTNVSHDAGAPVSEAAAVANGTSSAAIGFDTTIYDNDVSIVSTSQITFARAGLYNIQFSLQLLNYTTSEDNVIVWMKLNGSDVTQSASVQQVNSKHGQNPGAAILALNLFQQVSAGQYVELYWTSKTGNTVLGTYPAGASPTHPVSPAVILTATQVA